MSDGNGLSAGDILALSKNNGNDMMAGGMGFWWVIVFLIVAGMFNGNGFGFGNNGAGATLASDEFIKRDIFNTNQNVSETAARTQQEVIGTSCQTQRDILENRYTNQLGVQSIISSQKDCCCETKGAIMQNRYDNALGQSNLQRDILLGNKDLQAQLAQCCCDLRTSIHAEGEATRNMMQQDKIESLRDSLNTATQAYNNLSLANSVISQVRPSPVPAYITCSPYTTSHVNTGCNPYGYGYGYGVSTIV